MCCLFQEININFENVRLSILLYCIIFFAGNVFAQDRPVLQWQKNYGGSLSDEANAVLRLPDGNFILLGTTKSNDGDISGLHGTSGTTDVTVIKISPAGNIIWQKTYGGSAGEIAANIIQTSDGGFIFIGSTSSKDGDVSGNHGSGAAGTEDIWVVKLDASGNMLWQKCYGGTSLENGADILETAGGFMIAGNVRSTDGDAVGLHGIHEDVWIMHTGPTGNIIWQRCYGGTEQEVIFPGGYRSIKQTLDGNFIVAATTSSRDGDVSDLNHPAGFQDAWILKITPTGSIMWDKCIGGNYGDLINHVIPNTDGSFFLTGHTYSDDLPRTFNHDNGYSDGIAILLDASGNTQWLTVFGGALSDRINDAVKTPDGGYLLTGSTESADGNVCQKHLLNDMWLVKLDAAGNLQWNRTFGGSKADYGKRLLLTASNECYVFSAAASADGDIANNKGGNDMWLTKFSLTGPPSYPSVTITSKTDSIVCSGKKVHFVAAAVLGGTQPIFQWKLNGTNVGTNSDTLRLSNLQSTDAVTCVLTSNSPCVDIKTAVSNSLSVNVDPLQPPTSFLPGDTALCSFQRIVLKANRSFNSYLWSTNETSADIRVKQPGIYWLEVTDQFRCTGRDSFTIFPKTCIEGIFVPNAFTPDKNGKNDLFKPIMNADVKEYRFIVYNRWGQIVFETTTLNKGWDGTFKNMPENSGVFIWQCIYQLYGEAPASKRGTVLLLR